MPTTYPIPNGRKAFTPTLYTGTGSIMNVSNTTGTLYPDFLWVKSRSSTTNNVTGDTNVGIQNFMYTNTNAASLNDARVFRTVGSGYFQLGTDADGDGTNVNGASYVAWQWQAGQGVNTTNTAGSITSTVSVNQAAGFSIVTWTGNNANATVGHGLGATPSFIIAKAVSDLSSWVVSHSSLPSQVNNGLVLNSTNGMFTVAGEWYQSPNSTTFGVGPNVNAPAVVNVAYCWAPVPGYSQFGSYAGNGSSNGPFIYTGFRPAFVMIKNITTSVDDWAILDSTRNTYNPENAILFPNLNSAEASATVFNFYANGFKLGQSGNGANGSGSNYIYAAFAENPFKYANAR